MTLLVTPAELRARRSVVAGPLAPLADSLAADLAPLIGTEPFIPPEKALLSREGGRCPRDGTLLDFDPFSPRRHHCPLCGETYEGELHYRFWIYWYQLWLAERAVHAATLAALRDDAGARSLALTILGAYAQRYLSYPNRDNVLGPTRLFFSTYLESIWLLQICVATELLSFAGDARIGGVVRDRIIEPSRAIIAVYDEALSNRQVWNNVALLAAGQLVGDAAAVERALFGPSGVSVHLAECLLPDGTWYEGENYHLFAHRGLWYAMTMAHRAGAELQSVLVDRFHEGFATPFSTALPDFTLPSRRDSQYAISLRQWRIAEHTELGLARRDDARLVGALARLYGDEMPRRDTGRSRSSADVERNAPASALSRADLSWRALLHAPAELPDLVAVPPRSALLDAQGIAVFRRDEGRVYIALDYGHSGGGHGHPDRLNVLLSDGDVRWMDDMGTGSYVDPTLHWYRSTLAHNAPLVDGASQERIHGTLLAYDEHPSGDAGWIYASAEDVSPGTSVARTLVVMPEYFIDELEWRSDRQVMLDLPVHVDARIVSGASDPRPATLEGGHGLEDGFNFVHDATCQSAPAGSTVVLHAPSAEGRGPSMQAWWQSDRDTQWWRAIAPGAPGSGERAFRVARAAGDQGIHRAVWSWSGSVESAQLGDSITVRLANGEEHTHRRDDAGWHVTTGSSSGTLRGFVEIDEPAEPPAPPASSGPVLRPRTDIETQLGERHYRRSEESWAEAGRPTATVRLRWTGAAIRLTILVPRSDMTFVARDAVNPYDNEAPDINGDGVQVYFGTRGGLSGWMIVPERLSHVARTRMIDGWTTPQPIKAWWAPLTRGYQLDVEIPLDARQYVDEPIALDVLVNEKPNGRERRRGQLVWSGANGEFVYLRGDRHDASRLLRFTLANG